MQRVFVLDHQKRPLMPCTPARARLLLRRKRAAILRYQPFTIILHEARPEARGYAAAAQDRSRQCHHGSGAAQ